MRLYLSLCGLLLIGGLAGMVLTLTIPVETYDADGQLIGEMPPAFAVAFFMTVLGAVGGIAGCFVKAFRQR